MYCYLVSYEDLFSTVHFIMQFYRCPFNHKYHVATVGYCWIGLIKLGLVQSTGLLILTECSSFSMQTISDCFSIQTISNSVDRTMIEPSLLAVFTAGKFWPKSIPWVSVSAQSLLWLCTRPPWISLLANLHGTSYICQ